MVAQSSSKRKGRTTCFAKYNCQQSTINNNASMISVKYSEEPTVTKIRTVLRLRPTNNLDHRIIIKKNNGKDSVSISGTTSEFSFDATYDEKASNQRMYEEIVKGTVNQCLEGMNICFFAYGQTGSGKTYNIVGTRDDPGILPRFCDDLFFEINDEPDKVLIQVSFYEIYNEKAYDLLSEERQPLRLRGVDSNVYLDNLNVQEVKSSDDLALIRKIGLSRRATAATLANEHSSRSHAIFKINVKRNSELIAKGVEKKFVTDSNVYFVDLAGSERLAYTNGQHFNETIAINTSLLNLRRVIESYAEGRQFVNHRDSILTRLLKECFGGNSITTLFAMIMPDAQYDMDTLSTLKFASQCSLVKQRVQCNIDPIVQVIQDMKDENENLRAELDRLKKMELNKHILILDRPVPPCILQLMPDSSNTFWVNLECGIPKHWSLLDDDQKPGIRIACHREKDQILLENLDGNELFINTALNQEKFILLSHGDHVVYGGKHFLWVCLAETSPENIPSYEKIKLIYIEAISASLKEKLYKEAITELESEFNELISQLGQENDQFKKNYDALKEKLKKNKKNMELKQECEQVKACMKDTDDLRKTLLKDKNISDKKPRLVLSGMANGRSCIVRLTDVLQNCYAELDYEVFMSLSDKLKDCYQQSVGNPLEQGNHIGYIIGCENLDWMKLDNKGRRQTMIANRITNAFDKLAKTRHSNIYEVRQNFIRRTSVLNEFVKSDQEIHFHTMIELAQGVVSEPLEDSDHLYEYILKRAMQIEESFHNLNKISELCVSLDVNSNEFCKATFDIFISANSASNFHSYLVQLKFFISEQSLLASYLPEMIDYAKAFRNLIDVYLSSIKQRTPVRECSRQNFENQISAFYFILGRLSIERNFPLKDERFNQVKKHFQEGVLQYISDWEKDIIYDYPRYSKSIKMRARALLSVFDATVKIIAYIKAHGNDSGSEIDQHLVYVVFRLSAKLITYIKNSNSKEFEAEAVCRIKEIIENLNCCKSVPEASIRLIQFKLDAAKKLLDKIPPRETTTDLPPRPNTALN